MDRADDEDDAEEETIRREELAIARQVDESERNLKGLSLGLGSIPTGLLVTRLAQATKGYPYPYPQGQQPGATPPPPTIDINAILQQVRDEISMIVKDTISALNLVDQTALAALKADLNAAIGGINSAIDLIDKIPGVNIPHVGTVPTAPATITPATDADVGYTYISPGFKTQTEAANYSAGVPQGRVKQSQTDGLWYVEQPTIPSGGRH